MNWLTAIKKVGGAVLSTVIPGSAGIIKLVNDFLPVGRRLGEDATGHQVEEAIEALPPEHKAALLSKQLDVEITEIKEHTAVVQTLAEVDKAGASTRPRIAIIMAYVVAGTIGIFVLVWAIAILGNKAETLKQLAAAWPMMLSILTPPVALLRGYFGMRTKEKQSRYSTAFGLPLKGGFLTEMISAIKR